MQYYLCRGSPDSNSPAQQISREFNQKYSYTALRYFTEDDKIQKKCLMKCASIKYNKKNLGVLQLPDKVASTIPKIVDNISITLPEVKISTQYNASIQH